MEKLWGRYNSVRAELPPRELMVEAASLVHTKDAALDIGAGALTDSKYLLQNGFEHVTAIDKDIDSFDRSKLIVEENFEFVQTSFEDFEYGENTYDFINAQFSLPFIHPDKFNEVIKKIIAALKSDGVFCGQFFGTRDEWNTTEKGMTFLNLEEAKDLFENMKVVTLDEKEGIAKTALSKDKHWHIIKFVVRKKPID